MQAGAPSYHTFGTEPLHRPGRWRCRSARSIGKQERVGFRGNRRQSQAATRSAAATRHLGVATAATPLRRGRGGRNQGSGGVVTGRANAVAGVVRLATEEVQAKANASTSAAAEHLPSDCFQIFHAQPRVFRSAREQANAWSKKSSAQGAGLSAEVVDHPSGRTVRFSFRAGMPVAIRASNAVGNGQEERAIGCLLWTTSLVRLAGGFATRRR